jgi:hypothetical protein
LSLVPHRIDAEQAPVCERSSGSKAFGMVHGQEAIVAFARAFYRQEYVAHVATRGFYIAIVVAGPHIEHHEPVVGFRVFYQGEVFLG